MTVNQPLDPAHGAKLEELDSPEDLVHHEDESLGTKSRWGWLAGRGELGFVAVIVIFATVMLYGGLTMTVLGSQTPGPQFFPILIAVLLYMAAAAILYSVLTHPQLPDGEPHPGRGNFSKDLLSDIGMVDRERVRRRYSRYSEQWTTYSDWKTVGLVVVGLVVFIVALKPVGWILSATFLFWMVVRALGSKRTFFDLGVALLFASIIQLAFNEGLGLPLPPGFLEGLL
ncbi:tripartite tricarboxylate transporter TctB family protein [Corynebacterium crudilactis]|uniref:tripartite tricarboxylate transporter TctB family protein n=1 Tax=Corynebacterium crudilactis TaxID=1652495 RepID=UPI0009ED2474|nr:tripartite tricarboxylate transporter TctB family protein [Corynebacterium crudilactis]